MFLRAHDWQGPGLLPLKENLNLIKNEVWVPKEEREENKKKSKERSKGDNTSPRFSQGTVGIVFEWLKSSCLLV